MSKEHIDGATLAVLNCYRNKYYAEGNNTEQGVVANAINDVLPILVELKENGYRKIPDNIGEFSDGYHTFNELYHHRAVLFSVVCNMFPEKAWKSKLHDTGDMFEGMFIVGIETEQGQATYHYDIEPYWDMFKVKEIEKAPKWDGHTPSDAIQRIGSISSKQSEGEWRQTTEPLGAHDVDCVACSACGETWVLDGDFDFAVVNDYWNFCPNCGAHMRKEDEGK